MFCVFYYTVATTAWGYATLGWELEPEAWEALVGPGGYCLPRHTHLVS